MGTRLFRTSVVAPRTIVACMVVSFVACSPRERELRGSGFRYISRDNDALPEDVLTTLSQHRTAIEQYLELDPQQVGEVSYHKFRDRADLHSRGHCSPASSACFFRQWGVESYHAFERHELIHAYVAHWGDSHRLLEEGLAVSLSCDKYLPQKVDISAEVAFSQAAWATIDIDKARGLYSAGARFVAHLLRSYNKSKFRDFYTLLHPTDDFPTAQARFAEVFGAEIGHAWAQAGQAPGVDNACLYPYECSGPPLSLGGANAPTAQAFVTVVSTADTWLELRSPKADVWRLGGCGNSPPLAYEEQRLLSSGALRGESHWLALDAGKYWLAPSAAAVNQLPLASLVVSSERCETLAWPDVRINPDAMFVLSAASVGRALGDIPGQRQSLVMGFAAGDLLGERVAMECSRNARVELCTSCDYIACQVGCTAGIGSTVTMNSGRAVLKVTAASETNLWIRLRARER